MLVGISGANGKMGRECTRVFREENIGISFFVDSIGGEGVYKSFNNIDDERNCDVVVDFSSPTALSPLLDFCKKRKCAAVIATTGFSVTHMEEMHAAAREIPIFASRNMSIGINLLGRLCEKLSASFKDCDSEIVEIHHGGKRDAPSGTALFLADMLKSGRGYGSFVYDRHMSEKRKKGEIGIHSLRGGSVVGRHDVYFLMRGETLCLSHNAENRELFARGALAAAKFICTKEKGFFGMSDLVDEIFFQI